ncbi:MAG: hypothetical protein ACJAS3_003326 [Roseivirga sp.]
MNHFELAVELINNTKDKSTCLIFLGLSEIQDKNFDKTLDHLNTSLAFKETRLTRKSLALVHMELNNIKETEQIYLHGIVPEQKNKEGNKEVMIGCIW